MQGGEDDGMFKISEIHDTFSESAADSTLRKSLSMGDMELDGAGGGAVGEGGDDHFAGTQTDGDDDDGAKLKRKKSGEKDKEDDDATLRDATDDTSESTLPLNAGPTPTQSGTDPISKRDFPAAHPPSSPPPPPPPQRPILVHAATVATPARLRPRLFRQKSFEIDSDSDEVKSSALDVCGKGEQHEMETTVSDHESRIEGDPSGTGDASVKKSSARKEDMTVAAGEGESKSSSGGRAKGDRAKLKDKESSGEDPKSGKRAKIQGEKSKSGKSRRGSSGNRGCKKGGDGAQGSGFHSCTLPNPKKHHGRKKRHPGLTITIDNLKDSFDGYDKFIKTDADMLQHSPNFCIRFGPMSCEWVFRY